MTSAPINLLTLRDQNLIKQLKSIVRSPKDFDELNNTDKKALYVAALSAGLDSNKELFYLLREHPEYIGEPALSDVEKDTATVNSQVLAANVAQYLADKEALNKQVDLHYPDRTEKDREIIKKMIATMIVRRQAEILADKTNPKQKAIIAENNRLANTKTSPLKEITQTSQTIINTTISENKLQLPPAEEAQAVATFTTLVVSGENISDPDSLNQTLELVLANHLVTPTTDLCQNIEKNLIITDFPHPDDPSIVQVTPDLAVNLSKIKLPPEPLTTPSLITIPAPLQDSIEKARETSVAYSRYLLTNQSLGNTIAELNGGLTREKENELNSYLIAAGLVTRVAATNPASKAAAIVEGLNPINPIASGTAIRLTSQGLNPRELQQHLQSDPTSKLAQFFQHNPGTLRHVVAGLQKLEDPSQSQFLKEITPPPSTGPLSGLTQSYNRFTSSLTGFLPARAGQVFNLVTHPLQSFQSYLGQKVGEKIVNQLKTFVSEKIVSKIANETLKQGAQLILKEGLTKGLASLTAKLGLEATLGSTGIGAPVAALMLVGDLVSLLAKPIGSFVNNLFHTFTGEDFDARAALATPLLFFGGLAGFLGSATAIAASSAAIIILVSSFVGFILYVCVIAVAPIIAGIAHLESGQGVPYTVATNGVVPEGCPFGWPIGGSYITAGPRTASAHHHNAEAIDVGTYGVAGIPILATHNGLAISHQGSGGPYGNFVDVNGSCKNITFTTRYGHMLTTAFGGQRLVKQGEVIGYVDSTGNSTGNHLHYEIRGGNLGDINQFLPKRVPIGCDSRADCHTTVP